MATSRVSRCTVRAAFATVLTAVALAGCTSGSGGDVPILEYPVGERPAAPEVAGELLEGGRYDLAEHRGEVVVVNFWGSWCGPCRAETADLEQVFQDTRELGVSFVGINIRDSRDAATAFVQGRLSYPSIFDPGGQIELGFAGLPPIRTTPATLIIDRDGGVAVVIRRVVGRAELAQLVTEIAAPGGGAGG